MSAYRAGRAIRPFGGSRFVRRLDEGEQYVPHPDHGFIFISPRKAPTWLHVEWDDENRKHGTIVETPIELLPA